MAGCRTFAVPMVEFRSVLMDGIEPFLSVRLNFNTGSVAYGWDECRLLPLPLGSEVDDLLRVGGLDGTDAGLASVIYEPLLFTIAR